MKSEIHVIRTGPLAVNTYIVPLCDRKVFVVDPAASSCSRDELKIVDYLKEKKLECVAIILTHSHFDHILGIAQIKQAFPKAVIAIHEAEFIEVQNGVGPMNKSVLQGFMALDLLSFVEQQPAAEFMLRDGMTLDVLINESRSVISDTLTSTLKNWSVIHTPGHSPGSICLYNKQNGLLISGDTIFSYGGVGRTDMYGGDESTLFKSLSKIRKLIPQGTKVYPGHEMFGFSYE